MPNPNPQHNPTDGLGVAAFIQMARTNVNAFKAVGTAGNLPANPGFYTLNMSLTNAGGNHSTTQLTASLVDVHNNAYTPSGAFTYRSYSAPAVAGFYKPSNFGSYNAQVATVSGTGLITAVAVGQTIIEVAFPTFDNNIGTDPSSDGAEPKEFISVQVIVSVLP